MELMRQLPPPQLIWCTLTCSILLAGFLFIEKQVLHEQKVTFTPRSDDEGEEVQLLRTIRVEHENKQQVDIATYLQMLSRDIGGIPVGPEGSSLTESEARILREYLVKNILLPPEPRPRSNQDHQKEPSKSITTCENPLEMKLKELLLSQFQKPGFYVEARARNKSSESSLTSFTLNVLENELGWAGLLIEGVPALVDKIKEEKRTSWIAKACLSQNSTEYKEYISFIGTFAKQPRLNMPLISPTKSQLTNKLNGLPNRIVECFPLEHILEAVWNAQRNFTNGTVKRGSDKKRRSVDLLILDLDGDEYKVLNSIPTSTVPIKIIVLEHWLVPEGRNAFKGLMHAKNYFLTFESDTHYIFIEKKFLLGSIIVD